MAELMNGYGRDEQHEAALIESRVPSGFVCPACGCAQSSSFRRRGGCTSSASGGTVVRRKMPGVRLCRYAADGVIHCRSQAQARRACSIRPSGAGRTTVVGFDGRRCGQPGGAQEHFSMCLLSSCFLVRPGIDSREPR